MLWGFNKLIYFLPLLKHWGLALKKEKKKPQKNTQKKHKKTQNNKKETTKQNGADSGVIFAHHVNINYQLYKKNKVILV